MSVLTCGVVQDLMDLYLDGATSAKTSSLVEEHLRECARCRAVLERYRDARRALRASLGDVPPAEGDEAARDARTLARAQRRLRRRAAAALGITVVAALVLWAAVWLATTPAAPGLYLGRLRASQIVLTGSPCDGLALPVLWVPAYPGQDPPEMRTVVVSLGEGTPTLELNVSGVVWDKGWFGLPRYRKGTLHAHRGVGAFVSEGPASYFQAYGPAVFPPLWPDGTSDGRAGATWSSRRASALAVVGPAGQVLASTLDTDLTVVQTYGQSGHGNLTVGLGGSPAQLHFHLTATANTEVLEIVLPPSLRPLLLETAGTTVPLTLPLKLERDARALILAGPGASGVEGLPAAFKGVLAVTPLFAVQAGESVQNCVPGTYMTYIAGPLDELYDLQPR
ncbi:MAG: zf-HC2 domain-containing protein [Firmicutes bacterium]|nr:zf-HC2 domain-containing protein [Bacillota bacterium]